MLTQSEITQVLVELEKHVHYCDDRECPARQGELAANRGAHVHRTPTLEAVGRLLANLDKTTIEAQREQRRDE